MKYFLIVCVLLASVGSAARAQSLDIGGFELKIGQPVDEALRSLWAYQVKHSNGAWFVFQRNGADLEPLGMMRAVNNRISYIEKIFFLRPNSEYEELHRRGGTHCWTYRMGGPYEMFGDGNVVCGDYEVTISGPRHLDDGTLIPQTMILLTAAKHPRSISH